MPCTKINSKWIKGLKIKPKAQKAREENTGGDLLDMCPGNEFLPKAKAKKKKAWIKHGTASY